MSVEESHHHHHPRGPMVAAIHRLVHAKAFEHAVALVIIVNAVLIGVELTFHSDLILVIQRLILAFFVVEIVLRFVGRTSTRGYFTDAWNYFDVLVVAISFVPASLIGGASASVIRSLRILRLLRLLRHIEELRLITAVLLRSLKSLVYSSLLFFIFLYVYAVLGVGLFRHQDYASSVNAQLNPTNPDPYGTLGEAMFTLFRVLTGEDWTDLRYNLMQQMPEMDIAITTYHVSWMVLSGFLLINLVVGAVVNNYDRMMDEVRRDQEAEEQRAAAED